MPWKATDAVRGGREQQPGSTEGAAETEVVSGRAKAGESRVHRAPIQRERLTTLRYQIRRVRE